MNSPEINRKELRVGKQFLSAPMIQAYTKVLRKVYSDFGKLKDVKALLQVISDLKDKSGAEKQDEGAAVSGLIKAEDLHLICYDFVWS